MATYYSTEIQAAPMATNGQRPSSTTAPSDPGGFWKIGRGHVTPNHYIRSITYIGQEKKSNGITGNKKLKFIDVIVSKHKTGVISI